MLLNGYPGVCKLTIGSVLIPLIGGRLLDSHSVNNVAFALTEFKSAAFYDTVRAVRAVADARILALAQSVPVVLTDIRTEGNDWGDEDWARVVKLAEARPPLCVVVVRCAWARTSVGFKASNATQGASHATRPWRSGTAIKAPC
ncbi:MAG: hypothetical protein GY798_09515 [Hyphomicrobiales bacterium]|nr:hypothetical protein [Hyphomicrobiales bacterium]